MRDRERVIASGLVTLMLVLWLGFFVHRSPRFAGSLAGGVLGVSGAILMLVPLGYLFVKRIPPLRGWSTSHVSMATLLTWHIYAGIIGPILALLHTGHKFESPLGIALTAMMLIVVLSGFTGRYLMNQLSQNMQEKREMLTELEIVYRQAGGAMRDAPKNERLRRPRGNVMSWWVSALFASGQEFRRDPRLDDVGLIQLVDAMADLEYAVKTHESFRRWFGNWLKAHIVISLAFYGLLGLHVWAAVYFGLRWLS
ncbi:hypothetical protein K2X85_08300 [bacterium]|nr:hypothetical protein [bacterium]